MGSVRDGQSALCHALPVLSSLRDRRGRPNTRVRLLAIVLALLLAFPLTALAWAALADLVSALV